MRAQAAIVTGVTLSVLGAVPLRAQPATDAAALQTWLAENLPPLEAAIDCDVTVHGEPQLDGFSADWLVAYSAAGPQCDDMTEALLRLGAPVDVTFYRRPNADQVRGLIAKITRSIERGYGCRIVQRSEPRFDEDTNLWSVGYYGAGGDCNDAGEELSRQGKELRIQFLRTR